MARIAVALATVTDVGLVVDSTPDDQPIIGRTIAGDPAQAVEPKHAIEWEPGNDESVDSDGSGSLGGYGLLTKRFTVTVVVHLSRKPLTSGRTVTMLAADLCAEIEQLYYATLQAQQWPEPDELGGFTLLALKTDTTAPGGGVGFDMFRGTRATSIEFIVTYRHGMTDPTSPLPAGGGG